MTAGDIRAALEGLREHGATTRDIVDQLCALLIEEAVCAELEASELAARGPTVAKAMHERARGFRADAMALLATMKGAKT